MGENFSIRLRNRYGLHIRPATLLVQMVSASQSEVTISTASGTANGGNIMELLSLGAGCDTELQVKVTGDNAQAVAQQIRELIDSSFGGID